MTKINLPADEAAFEKLRAVARRTAGQATAPRPTSTSGPELKPSPSVPAPKLDGPGPKTPEGPRPRAAASNSSGRERPARIPEKAKVEETPEFEPELDLVDLFHGRHG